MEFLAVMGILSKVASAAGSIFRVSQFMYNYVNKVKSPQELMDDCRQMLGDVNRRFGKMSQGSSQLSERVEGLAHTTTSGFERISEAFSQVILLLIRIWRI
jgi:hypothetical protein